MSPTIAAYIAAARSGGLVPLPAKIGDLLVSALVGLSAPSELNVTRKPIEAGYEVADAAIEVPQELVMDVVLSNPDLSPTAAITAAISGAFGGFFLTWRDKRDYLYEVQESRQLLEVITHEGWYTNMLLQSIDPIFDVDENWDCFIATLRLIEVKTIATGIAGLIDSALATKGKL